MTGDFNSDGLRDVAWAGGGTGVYFATVCPGSVTGTMCEGKQALEVLLNSESLTVQHFASMTAGSYGTYDGTGLLVITSPPYNANDPTRFYARWYQLDNDWNAIGGSEISSVLYYNSYDLNFVQHTMAVSEKLDWLGGTDQAIVASQVESAGSGGNAASVGYIISVITFDSALNTMTGHTTGPTDWHNTGFIDPINPPWLNGLAVGRFAAIDDDPDDADFNPQIAVLRNDRTVHFFSVDPTNEDYKPKSLSALKLDSGLGINNIPTLGLFSNPPLNPEPYPKNWLSTGDLQGRSALLGSPTVIRIDSHSQPSVILGAPPMHVDYILPDQATATEWQVVNFSAVPDTFNSNYTMSETTTNQSADTNRTSYTYATTEQGGGKFKIKVPVIGSIGGGLKKSTENKHETVSETYAFKQNEFKYDASTTTGFGDEIWYDESSFNPLHVSRHRPDNLPGR